MNDQSVGVILSTIAQGIAAASMTALVWVGKEFLPLGNFRIAVALVVGVALLYPVKYRWDGQNGGRWIKIPYIVVGFCELAIVIFDRFKPSASKSETSQL